MSSTVLRAITVAGFASLALAGNSFAGKYGAAGCGLGAVVLGDEPGMVQVVAGILNNIVVPQTFAISSGTLECTEDGVSLKDKEQEFFASANFESLNQEMAQGRGENLQAMAYLFGCTGEGVETFSAVAHDNYGEIFPSGKTTSSEMLSNLKDVVKQNPQVQASCSENG